MNSRRCFSLPLLMALILVITGTTVSEANDLRVCPGCPYTTIQSAIYAATPETDRVVVGTTGRASAETYTENITMKSGVDVVSEPADDTGTVPYTDGTHSTMALQRATLTIIDGSGSGSAPAVVFSPSVSASTKLDGFIVENIDGVVTRPIIQILGGGANSQVTNCIIRDNQADENGNEAGAGITVSGEVDAVRHDTAPTIDHNLIHNISGPGIANGPCSHATIANNEIWDCNGDLAPGIGLREDTWPTIEDNLIFNNDGAGIGSRTHGLNSLSDVEDLNMSIKGNTIHHNSGAGIWLSRADGDAGYNINVEIGGENEGDVNNIHHHSKPAVVLHDLNQALVQKNHVHDNTHVFGVFVSDVAEAVFKQNTFESNQRALCIVGASAVTVGGALGSGESNTFNGNAVAGIFFGSGASGPFTPGPCSEPVTIQGNQLYNNGGSVMGAAIVVYGDITGEVTIDQNNMHDNHVGIAFRVSDDSSVLNITRNNIHNNTRTGIVADALSCSTCADLTVTQNKIHHNGTAGGAGCNLIDAAGVVENNLFYRNAYIGLVFGENVTMIKNNTVVHQTGYDSVGGAGIKYYRLTETGESCENVGGAVPDPPDIDIKNNIFAYNEKGGLGKCTYCGEKRDYNLLYSNNGTGATDCGWESGNYVRRCVERNYGGCGLTATWPWEPISPNDIIADPLFEDMDADNYHLQSTPAYLEDSPAIGAGEGGVDMGAYGGSSPLVDDEIPAD